MRDVVILGSTGSVGSQAIDVVGRRLDQFHVTALTAGGAHPDVLAQQIGTVHPDVVAVAGDADALREALDRAGTPTAEVPEILEGPDASTAAARLDCDVVLNGITGEAGLLPTLAALEHGTTLALANKESLVVGRVLVTRAAAEGQIVPVDSEHCAFAQCLRAGKASEVRKLILTASGGPFRGWLRSEMENVKPAQAMAHPTWHMGRVVTINSSTMVNKGLELLEASLLFDVDLDAIQVVVHPQSMVHSMVEFHDGSTIAQASPPDMRLPIAWGLTWPDRLADAARPVDWTEAHTWTFEPLDADAFPAVELARRCGKAGGTAPAVFNAANEVCVDAFCAGRIGFLDIVDTLEAIVDEHLAGVGPEAFVGDDTLSVDAVLAADSWARARAEQIAVGADPEPVLGVESGAGSR